jgi:serine/threonine protein kinase
MNANKIGENRMFTLLYRSPELIDSNYLDYSIDYWSFGICVYLMLTGSYPFEDKEINDIHHIMPDPNEKKINKR